MNILSYLTVISMALLIGAIVVPKTPLVAQAPIDPQAPAVAPVAGVPPSSFTQLPEDAPHWTVRNGLTLALHPKAIYGNDSGGPRGLIRLGLPLRTGDAHPFLLNFIAVEPITLDGRRGFSAAPAR